MKPVLSFAILAFFFVFGHSYAQNVSANEKKKIKIQLWSKDKLIPANQVFGKNLTEIGVKIFPFDKNEAKEEKKLIITDFEVILLRHGQKIAEQTISGVVGSIDRLVALAKNDDTYAINIKEVYEVTKTGTLKLYAKGNVLMNYLFFDPKLEVAELKP